MMKWENVTHTFTEEQRHYKETYLEICEYQRCKEPTGEFINDFAEKYKLCLPNDALFDADDLFDMF